MTSSEANVQWASLDCSAIAYVSWLFCRVLAGCFVEDHADDVKILWDFNIFTDHVISLI